jgi:hypothetical protein
VSPSGVVMARRVLKPAAAAALLPTVSATCLMWCKADAGATKPDSSPATATGDNVNALTDQSYAPAQGHNLVTQTAGVWGTYQLNQINGLPCVRFGGATRMAAAWVLPAPFDIFVMCRPISYVAEAFLVASASGDSFGVLQHGTTPAVVVYNGASLAGNNTNLALGTWALMETGGTTGATNAFIKVNNTATTSGGLLTVADRGGVSVAGHSGNTNMANMDVAEILVYDNVLSGTDAAAVRTYFTGRYGIP